MVFQTVFGWGITGECKGAQSNNSIHFHVTCEPEEDWDQLLKKFWEVEQVPTSLDSSLNAKEKQAGETFRDSVPPTTRWPKWSWSPPQDPISQVRWISRPSMPKAILDGEITNQTGDWPVFWDVVLDCLHQDHAENSFWSSECECYYFPMHAVTKQSSTTTKVRIVFDALAKTTNGKSLNSILSSGPNVYNHSVQQILRFRIHRVTADISKMLRQILIAGTDTVESVLQLRPQLNKLLEKGRFVLRKWISNSQKLSGVYSWWVERKGDIIEFVSHDDYPKTVALHWNTLKDEMYVSIPRIEYHGKLTKRQLVSGIAKVYDIIMGWLHL